MLKSLLASMSLATLAVLAASTPAAAAPSADDQPPRVAVRYDDLNLSRPAGVHALKGRIEHAARTVCGAQPDIRNLAALHAYESCLTHAEESARQPTDQLLAHMSVQEPH